MPGADVVMPNRQELAAASRMPVDTEAAIVAAAQHLRAQHGFGAVVVTRGNDGMTLVDATGSQHFPAEAADVFDTSGAGDTALAALGAALAAQLSICRWRCGWRTWRREYPSARSGHRWCGRPICSPR